jgi:hypothetical protein
MNGPTREEMNANIAAVKAQVSERMTVFESKLDGLAVRMDAGFERTDARFTHLEAEVQGVKLDNRDMRKAFSRMQSTMVVTCISTGLAVVLGVGAFNATLLSNMMASFESGHRMGAAEAQVLQLSRETAAIVGEVKRQSDAQSALLRQLDERLPPKPAKTP